jgi:hypothetical protein
MQDAFQHARVIEAKVVARHEGKRPATWLQSPIARVGPSQVPAAARLSRKLDVFSELRTPISVSKP